MNGAEYKNLMSLLRSIRRQLKQIKQKLDEQSDGGQKCT